MLAASGLSLSVLGGCLFVTDTTRVNPDVFAAEVTPVWNEKVAPPPPATPADKFKNLFTGSRVQGYGMPATDPLTTSAMPAAVSPGGPVAVMAAAQPSPFSRPPQAALYQQIRDEGHTINALPLDRIDRRLLRQEVAYATNERPGTIVVDTKAHYLYLVEGEGRAMRYGVGLGKQGFAWQGRGTIQFKRKWPRWTPSDEMVGRQPDLKHFASAEGGLEPGLNNPLGARALYIFKNGKDTLYRIHGTPDWQSVGKAVSSGCVRMFNHDVIDLYNRAGERAEIVVL
ncbi:L,D-transpeptidase [Allorhizobium undicola]|uniref:L,D-transpeptidase n=1 Tax=Allorhizobium undicola TaxID=78527 RepID=UPI003D34763D